MQIACPTCALCMGCTSLLMLPPNSVTAPPQDSPGRWCQMVNLQQGAIKLWSYCQTILLWALRVTQRCLRCPWGMRCEGGEYTSSRRAPLLSISHLNFWNKSDSSAITEKSMKSQDTQTQFTRKSPWLTVEEIGSGVLVLPLLWLGANHLTPGDSCFLICKMRGFCIDIGWLIVTNVL